MARPLSKKFLQLVVASAFVGAGYGVKLQYMQKPPAVGMVSCQKVWDDAMLLAGKGAVAPTAGFENFKLGLLIPMNMWSKKKTDKLRPASALNPNRYCGSRRTFEGTEKVEANIVEDAKSAVLNANGPNGFWSVELMEGIAFRDVLRSHCCLNKPNQVASTVPPPSPPPLSNPPPLGTSHTPGPQAEVLPAATSSFQSATQSHPAAAQQQLLRYKQRVRNRSQTRTAKVAAEIKGQKNGE
ncbi:unnamed protein product [Amoebophrya sp. A25]|nr:unnamed protein product [Amoebophrya sp. A25]|eukprot:GSA25T00026352001.1